MLKDMVTLKNIAMITLVLFSSLLVLNFTSDGSSSGSCSSDGCSSDGCSSDEGSSDEGSSGRPDYPAERPESTTPSSMDDMVEQTGAADYPENLPDNFGEDAATPASYIEQVVDNVVDAVGAILPIPAPGGGGGGGCLFIFPLP